MPLLNEASNVLLGTQQVSAVYQGDVKVWPPASAAQNNAAWWDFSKDSADGWTIRFQDAESVEDAAVPRIVDGALTADPFVFVENQGGTERTFFSPTVLVDPFQFDCDVFIPFVTYRSTSDAFPLDGEVSDGQSYQALWVDGAVGTVQIAETYFNGQLKEPGSFMSSWETNQGLDYFHKTDFDYGEPYLWSFNFEIGNTSKTTISVSTEVFRIGFIDYAMYTADGTVRPVGLLPGSSAKTGAAR